MVRKDQVGDVVHDLSEFVVLRRVNTSDAGRGSIPCWKYASPRPRTCTSSVLKPPLFAALTIVAIAAGEVSVVRTTHNARTSSGCA